MALTNAQRQQVRRQWVQRVHPSPCEFTEGEINAAADAISQLLEDSADAINDAFPTAFRNTATVNQKAWILALVAAIEYGGE